MKLKHFALITILLFVGGLLLAGCGGGGGGSDGGTVTPTPTPTPTQENSKTVVMAMTDTLSLGSNIMDNSGYVGGTSDKKAVVVPTAPTQPPTIPSGPGYTSETYTYTYGDLSSTVTMYVFSDLKLEWTESETYQGSTISKGYYVTSAPVTDGSTTTRTFSFSRWTQNDTVLVSYGEGTALYDLTTGVLDLAGTQVIKTANEQVAYSVAFERTSTGAVSGSMEFSNGATATYTRTALDESATTSSDAYFTSTAVVQGVLVNMTVERTVYGDSSQMITKTGTLFTSTFDFNADGSGSGTIVNNTTQATNTIVWDSTGSGTLTRPDNTTYSFYVPIPYVFRY
ncbi:MAG: hypothetical protein K8T10_13060 [Candidatus Eremiobacteraeota bacterium]|nr:hypothetical protein [Candidatus Eremiobacteraeota bacterium]